MTDKRTAFRIAVASLVAVATSTLALADDPPKGHTAGELKFEAPTSWKAETPKSAMRKAQFRLEPVKGDTESAEMVVFVFPKGAGTVEANIARWSAQFKDADGKAPKAVVTTVKGKNVDVTRVEVAGRYVAAVTPGASETLDKPDFRLLGAIVLTDDAGYFFKMVGPEKTMKSALTGFDVLIASIRKSE